MTPLVHRHITAAPSRMSASTRPTAVNQLNLTTGILSSDGGGARTDRARGARGSVTERVSGRTSRTLERRYREATNQYDGTRNVTTLIGREGSSSARWDNLEYGWEGVVRRRAGRQVPQSSTKFCVRPPFPSTRDFFTDSVYSPTQKTRPPQQHSPAIKGPPGMRWGDEPLRETEAGRVGEWRNWKVVERPSTAGTRCIPWNHHWNRA
jgi:hypothetical protein